MNSDEYLRRINYSGSTRPTLENLNQLFRAHRRSIPSTNVDAFGGQVRQFTLEDIFEFVVRRRRGGICYEVNSLFNWLLNELGFHSEMIQSGFFFRELNKFGDKFSHMALLITIEEPPSQGRYVVNLTYSDALPLKIDYEGLQVQPKGIFRVRTDAQNNDCFYVERHKKTVLGLTGKVLKQGPGGDGLLHGKCGENCAEPNSAHWTPAFRFSPVPHSMEEFESAYRAQVHNPRSYLRNNLRMLLNTDRMSFKFVVSTLSISVPSGPATDRIVATTKVTSDEEVAGIVQDVFGLESVFEIKYFGRKIVENGK